MDSTLEERELGIEDVVVSMVGWLGDPDCRWQWPPPWRPPENAPEKLGRLVRVLGMTQSQYETCAELAHQLVNNPAFRQAVGLVVARALMVAPRLDHESTEILRKAAGVPQP